MKETIVRNGIATIGTAFFPIALLWVVTHIAYWLAGSPTEHTVAPYGDWWFPVAAFVAFFGGFAFTFLFRLHWILRVLLFIGYAPAQAGVIFYYGFWAACYLGNNCL